MDAEDMVISDPQFMEGNPIIKGTRITVESILREFARGMNIGQILEEYPQLTREDIKAALEFAAESVRFDHVHSLKSTPKDSPKTEHS